MSALASLCTVHCKLYTVNCTLYTVHCLLITVHCIFLWQSVPSNNSSQTLHIRNSFCSNKRNNFSFQDSQTTYSVLPKGPDTHTRKVQLNIFKLQTNIPQTQYHLSSQSVQTNTKNIQEPPPPKKRSLN